MALHNIHTTQDAKKLRQHLKFLTSDFLCNELVSKNSPNVSPHCELCASHGHSHADSIEHIVVSCRALSEVRGRLLPELMNIVMNVQPSCGILQSDIPPDILTQFVLDCCSPNLSNLYRIPAHNPRVSEIFKISRDWCFAISRDRTYQLRCLERVKAKTTLAHRH